MGRRAMICPMVASILLLIALTCRAAVPAQPRMLYAVSDPDRRLVVADEKGRELHTVYEPGIYTQWSPDGSRIMTDIDRQILVVGLDLKKARRVRGQVEGERGVYQPAWSADGRSIVYVGMLEGVLSMGVDDEKRSQVCPESKDLQILGVQPSPDGKRLAAFALPAQRDPTDTGADVFVMGADCSKPVRLTNDKRHPSDLSWSRDGKSLAFTLDGKLVVLAADGGQRREFKEGYHGGVSWTDDGRLLTTWVDVSVPKDRTSFLGILDPATGLATVLRKGVNTGFSSPGWRPLSKKARVATKR